MSPEVTAGALYGGLLLAGSLLGIREWTRRQGQRDRWPRCANRLVRRPIAGADILLIGLILCCTILAATAVLYATGTPEGAINPKVVMVQSVAVHWTILGVVVVLMRLRGTDRRRVFGVHPDRVRGDAWRGAHAYLLMLPAVFFCSVIYRAILHLFQVDLGMQDVAGILTGDAPPLVRSYLLFLGIFVAPLAEEILFRGMLFPVLARRLGATAAMVFVSALFAAIHVHVPSLVPLFVLSMCMCMAYVYTGSIVVPVVMHMLFNAFNLALVFVVLQA